MLPTNNLTQTDQTKASVDRSMVVAAYRYQVQTIRDRLASFPGADREPLAGALDALDLTEDYLSLWIESLDGDQAA